MIHKEDRYTECIYLEQISYDKNKWLVIESDDMKGIRISYINNDVTNPIVTEIRCHEGKLTSMMSNFGWDIIPSSGAE